MISTRCSAKRALQDLGLVITDGSTASMRQRQRAARRRPFQPHVLVMSATPSPRTHALILYGDLDLSVVHDCAGTDRCAPYRAGGESERPLPFIREKAAAGSRPSWSVPLWRRATGGGGRPGYVQQLWGREGAAAGLTYGVGRTGKEAVISSFSKGLIDVLVTTNHRGGGERASYRDGDRGRRPFRTLQLHQLRGDGPGSRESWC